MWSLPQGAIEMLGSGDPAFDGGGEGWYTGSIVRYNNISDTVGSSSSDGKNVCVHGVPGGSWCRRLVWGIYLDGGQSGVQVCGHAHFPRGVALKQPIRACHGPAVSATTVP